MIILCQHRNINISIKVALIKILNEIKRPNMSQVTIGNLCNLFHKKIEFEYVRIRQIDSTKSSNIFDIYARMLATESLICIYFYLMKKDKSIIHNMLSNKLSGN